MVIVEDVFSAIKEDSFQQYSFKITRYSVSSTEKEAVVQKINFLFLRCVLGAYLIILKEVEICKWKNTTKILLTPRR